MEESEILLKVQAFVDGELPESDQPEIAALMARDSDVHALVKELKQTRQALVGFEDSIVLPERGDFHWSKIRSQLAPVAGPEPDRERVSPFGVLLRWFLPAGALAAAAVALLMVVRGDGAAGDEVAWTAMSDEVNAFAYRDYEGGMTLMWLTYSDDNAVAESAEPATLN